MVGDPYEALAQDLIKKAQEPPPADPYEALARDVIQKAKPSALGYVGELGKSFAAGAIGTVGEGLTGVSVLQKKAADILPSPLSEWFGSQAVGSQWLGERINEAAPRVNATVRDTLPMQIASGAGSTATFIGTGVLAGPEAGVGAMIARAGVAAATGGFVQSGAAYHQAIAEGAPEGEAVKAAILNFPGGMTEAITVAPWAGRFFKALSGVERMSGRAIGRMLLEGGEEGAQEAFQQGYGEWVSQYLKIHPEDQSAIFDAASSGFLPAFLTGGLVSGLISTVERGAQDAHLETPPGGVGGEQGAPQAGGASLQGEGQDTPSFQALQPHEQAAADQLAKANGFRTAWVPAETAPEGPEGALAPQDALRVVPAPERVQRLAGRYGARVLNVASPDGSPLVKANGVYDAGTIVLDASMPEDLQVRKVLGHELYHRLYAEDQEEAEGLAAAQADILGPERMAVVEGKAARHGPKLAAEEAGAYSAEYPALALADLIEQPVRFAKVLERRPSLGRALVDVLRKMLRLVGIRTGQTYGEQLAELEAALGGADMVRAAIAMRDAYAVIESENYAEPNSSPIRQAIGGLLPRLDQMTESVEEESARATKEARRQRMRAPMTPGAAVINMPQRAGQAPVSGLLPQRTGETVGEESQRGITEAQVQRAAYSPTIPLPESISRGTEKGKFQQVYVGDEVEVEGRKGRVVETTGSGERQRALVAYPEGDYAPVTMRAETVKIVKQARGAQVKLGERDKERRDTATKERAEGAEPRFSLAPPVNSDAFRRWFGESKVVTEDGAPKRVYHGTSRDFTDFRRGVGEVNPAENNDLGFFFAEQPADAAAAADSYGNNGPETGANLKPVYLAIRNPATMRSGELFGLTENGRALLRRLIAQGYDGIHVPSSMWWVAFRPTQVKSVTGNRGTFSPSDPDIRFSLSDLGKPDALGFYSRLERLVATLPEKLPAASALSKIKAQANKEELEFSGLEEFLKGKDKVTRDEIAEYLLAHNVRVEEVVLGGDRDSDDPNSRYMVAKRSAMRRGVPEAVFRRAWGERNNWVAEDAEGNAFDEEDLDEFPYDERFPEYGEILRDTIGAARLRNREWDTKFANYQLPGGENYRELLLTLPEPPELKGRRDAPVGGAHHAFTGGHFDEPNVLAHIRVNDRMLGEEGWAVRNIESGNWGPMFATEDEARAARDKAPDIYAGKLVVNRRRGNKKTLFIEEIQSDWHGAAHKKIAAEARRRKLAGEPEMEPEEEHGYGYAGNAAEYLANERAAEKAVDDFAAEVVKRHNLPEYMAQSPTAAANELQLMIHQVDTTTPSGKQWWIDQQKLGRLIDAYKAAQNATVGNQNRVPNAPFKALAYETLAMKRVLLYAAQNGYEQVAWTTGAQQIDRYDEALRKNVDKIEVEPRGELHIRSGYRIMRSNHPSDADRPWVLTETFDGEEPSVVSTFATSEEANREADSRKAATKPVAAKGSVYIKAWKNSQEQFGALVPLEGTTSIHGKTVDLTDVVGKEIASKIKEKPGEKQVFEGEGLSIGGKGLKAEYDVRLPAIAKKLTGVAPTQAEMGRKNTGRQVPDGAGGLVRTGDTTEANRVHVLPIDASKIKEFSRFSLAGEEGQEPHYATTSKGPKTRARRAEMEPDVLPYVSNPETEARADELLKSKGGIVNIERALWGGGSSLQEQAATTVAAQKHLNNLIGGSFRTGRTERAQRIATGYYALRNEQGRALQAVRNPKSARERLYQEVATPTKRSRDEISALNKRLKKAKTASEKAAIRRQIKKIEEREARFSKNGIDALNKAGLNPERYSDAQLDSNPGLVQRMGRIYNAARSTGWDWLLEYRVSGMISSPLTFSVNATSNAANLAYKGAVLRSVEAMMNAVPRREGNATPGEQRVWFTSLVQAMPLAFHNFVHALRTEAPVFEAELERKGLVAGSARSKEEQEGRRASIPGWAGRLVRLQGITPMMAADEFFKTLAATAEANALAYRAAKGDAAQMRRLLADETSGIWEQALGFGKEATFQDSPEGGLANVLFQARGWADEQGARFAFGAPIGSFLLPFIRTPTNIFRAGLRIPGAPYILARDIIKRESGDVIMRDSAEAAVALAAALWLIQWAGDRDDDGVPTVTGSAPIDVGGRALSARVAPQFSFRYGDEWVSYARLEPFATAFGLLVDAAQKGDPIAVAKGFYGQAKDKTFLRTVGDIARALENPEGGAAARVFSSIALTPMIPNFIQGTVRAGREEVDVNTVRPHDDGGSWAAIPGDLGQRVGLERPPLRYDLWGREIQRSGRSWLARMIDPMQVQGDESERVRADVAILNWNDNLPPDEKPFYPRPPDFWYDQGGKRRYFTDEEYSRLQKRSGELATRMVARVRFDEKAPTKRDMDAISDAIGKARTRARAELKREHEARVGAR